MANINYDLGQKLKYDLKVYATKKGITIKEVVITAVKEKIYTK